MWGFFKKKLHVSISGNKPLALNLKRCRFDQTAGLTVCGSGGSTDSKTKMA